MIQAIRKRMNQKGFTLVELMVVIAILGVLAAIAIPRFSASTASANTAKIQADLRTLDSAIMMATAAGATITAGPLAAAGLGDYLAETPHAPTGQCFIGGQLSDINADGYQIVADGNTFRAQLGGRTSSGYGKDAIPDANDSKKS